MESELQLEPKQKEAPQQEMPFAIVEGEPLTILPKDLFIPPDALEVFLEAFEGPLDLLLYLIKRQNLDILEIPLAEITVYSTMEPCLMCYSTMILNGIRKIVYAYEDVMGGGTNLPLQQLNPLYRDMNVELVPDVLRERSLSLFKRFFLNPANNYWKDSLLSSYTLSQ